MTRPITKRQFPGAIIGSTVGTTLISITAAWLVTSHAFAPVVATPDTARIEHAQPYKPSVPSTACRQSPQELIGPHSFIHLLPLT
jgi:hypothetical protein